MERPWIEQYLAGAEVPRQALQGLTKTDLQAFPVPGTWSIQQILLHLMDSDLVASDHMKRVIAEEAPTLLGYDESAFARHLFYHELDPVMACDIFYQNRLLTGAILGRLPDAAFQRSGNHNQAGRLTLADLVRIYVQHLDHHMRFLHEKRRLLGKPSA